MRAITKRLNLKGVHGPLYELFTVSDKYKTAIEAVAGNSLFHVVVDNDDVAQKIIEVMNKEQSGRVTFMPLNRLKSVNVPNLNVNDVVPLIQKIEYNRAYKMAFEQVFGRTLLCSDLTLAGQYVRSHGLNCVTDEGDRVDRKGALTGGYHDVRRSRLDAVRGVKRWREVYDRDAARHAEVKDSVAKLEQEITQAMGNIQKNEAKRKALLEDRQHQARQANWSQREEEQARQRLQRLEGSLADAEAALKAATAQREALQEELRSPLTQQLSPVEVEQLKTLSQDAEKQKKALLEASQEREKVRSCLVPANHRSHPNAVNWRLSSRRACAVGERKSGLSSTIWKARPALESPMLARSSSGRMSSAASPDSSRNCPARFLRLEKRSTPSQLRLRRNRPLSKSYRTSRWRAPAPSCALRRTQSGS